MEINDTIKVDIESYDVNGYGVTHIDKKVVFVIGAMVSETVIAKIIDIKKKFIFAETIKILKKSENRIDSLCPYSSFCGGCDLLYMNYNEEAKIKEDKVKMTLRNFKNINFLPLIKSDNPYGYRNKVMVPFKRDIEDDVIYGFYSKKTHEIIPMEKCIISDDTTNEILHLISRYLNLFHISIYDEKNHTGIFREAMVRHTKHGKYMIVLIIRKQYDFSSLVDILTKEFSEIESIYININDLDTNILLGNEYKLIYGNKTIEEDILGLKFNVSAESFMQVNNTQCEKLYTKAIELANLKSDMIVIDAYCGMGSITLNIAKHVSKVYGIEIVEKAIENANTNKTLNNINNVEFIAGKCEDEIKKLVNKEKIDVIFFDPPRKGCEKSFLDTVILMNIPKIVYISCNIATCARDIKILEDNGYLIKTAVGVDLFPRTSHVETITLLEKDFR